MNTVSVSVRPVSGPTFHAKDPVSSLTHFIGLVLCVLFGPALLIYAADCGAPHSALVSVGVFLVSISLLYAASASYHAFHLSDAHGLILKKLDHMMIYVLIAGTYTPFCTICIGGSLGKVLLAAVWGIAGVGMLFTACWVTCPKWVSSVIYIAMGWACIFKMPVIIHMLSASVFIWLLAGGVLYTIGGIIYAMKMPVFNGKYKNFGSHELFHLFVMAGTLCHVVMVFTAL